jgi:hypothetical protein
MPLFLGCIEPPQGGGQSPRRQRELQQEVSLLREENLQLRAEVRIADEHAIEHHNPGGRVQVLEEVRDGEAVRDEAVVETQVMKAKETNIVNVREESADKCTLTTPASAICSVVSPPLGYKDSTPLGYKDSTPGTPRKKRLVATGSAMSPIDTAFEWVSAEHGQGGSAESSILDGSGDDVDSFLHRVESVFQTQTPDEEETD